MGFLGEAFAELLFVSSQLGFDVANRFALLDDVVAVAAQEVVDGLDANPDGAGGLILVEILEAGRDEKAHLSWVQIAQGIAPYVGLSPKFPVS